MRSTFSAWIRFILWLMLFGVGIIAVLTGQVFHVDVLHWAGVVLLIVFIILSPKVISA